MAKCLYVTIKGRLSTEDSLKFSVYKGGYYGLTCTEELLKVFVLRGSFKVLQSIEEFFKDLPLCLYKRL